MHIREPVCPDIHTSRSALIISFSYQPNILTYYLVHQFIAYLETQDLSDLFPGSIGVRYLDSHMNTTDISRLAWLLPKYIDNLPFLVEIFICKEWC